MRRFYLDRKEDATGVSGTGKVAEGVQFSNGWCALTWLTEHTSVVFYMNIKEVEFVHGHGGMTQIVFVDPIEKIPTPSINGLCNWQDNVYDVSSPRCTQPSDKARGWCIDHKIQDWNW